MSDDHNERRSRDERRLVPAQTQADSVAPGQVSRSAQLRRRANPEPSALVQRKLAERVASPAFPSLQAAAEHGVASDLAKAGSATNR